MIVTKIGSKSQAKLELFKTDRRIEQKIEQHVNELGKHNTDEEVDYLLEKLTGLVEQLRRLPSITASEAPSTATSGAVS